MQSQAVWNCEYKPEVKIWKIRVHIFKKGVSRRCNQHQNIILGPVPMHHGHSQQPAPGERNLRKPGKRRSHFYNVNIGRKQRGHLVISRSRTSPFYFLHSTITILTNMWSFKVCVLNTLFYVSHIWRWWGVLVGVCIFEQKFSGSGLTGQGAG